MQGVKNFFIKVSTITLLGTFILPFSLLAAEKSPFYYGAWLPFWKKQEGAQEIALNLDKFREISPFSYEVRANGTLVDKLKINEGLWPAWLKAARDLHVKIIPSVALLDGNKIHKLLSNTKLRRMHEDNIASLVVKQRFDGIDIDYEDKKAETRKYFSLLLEGLAIRLHPKGKILSCTIEARTPPTSQFKEIPKNLEYANDYKAINRWCDEVRIMAYDQGSIDLHLDAEKGSSTLYMPVADPDWVEKVLNLTTKTINQKKIMLGIPTYGYMYEISWNDGITTYKRLKSVTFKSAMELANAVGAAPSRNGAGELSFTYATSTSFRVPKGLVYTISSTTVPSILISPKSPTKPITRLVWFNDAAAMADKVRLAKKYKLRGVVFFKMDGETDPALWEEIK